MRRVSQDHIILGGVYSGAVAFDAYDLSAPGDFDGFVAELDPAGATLWARGLNASVHGRVNGVSVDTQGAIAVSGVFRGGAFIGQTLQSAYDDAFVAKLDSLGAPVWAHAYGASANDTANAVAFDSRGHVYATGAVSASSVDFGGGLLPGTFFDDLFVLELDQNGAHACSRRYAGNSTSQSGGEAIAVDSSAAVFVGGSFTGTIDFGAGPLSSSGGPDILMAAFDPASP